MVQLTLQVPDELADRIKPMVPWLAVVLELGLLGCRTPAAATAAEVMGFLSQDPTPTQILDFRVSGRAQERLRRLLTLNAAGMLGEEEQVELDELQKIEHIVIMLKAREAGQERRVS